MSLAIVFTVFVFCNRALTYEYDFSYENGVGRRFDGIGAISGGGATSKLLVDYPEPQRSEILDFLFKPNFGASFQIFKVEIGGDVQSSEGTESSHMHEEWDENYQRGYEWWLMTEAKKRNPRIRLCGLAWGYPGWLSDGSWSPYSYPNKTAHYIMKWIWGAKKYYNLDIDCVGIWNEKPYDTDYIKILRRVLDGSGMSKVKIVAADMLPGGAWSIVADMLDDEEVMKAVDIIGVHYMGSEFNSKALGTNKPVWSTEDWASDIDENGGGCMAQTINRNYVYGQFTGFIAWNMLCGFYPRMSYDGTGMMLANEPWSGHYEVGFPIWAMAHTTQFTEIGWQYLKHGEGVGTLGLGGTYVALVSPDMKQFTIVVETMDTSGNKFCNRPPAFPRKVYPQQAKFVLKGKLAAISSSLHVWKTLLNVNSTQVFSYLGEIKILDGRTETLNLDVNSIYTFTTLSTGLKGMDQAMHSIPKSERFPKSFSDDYEDYTEFQEAYGFAQQIGAFEIRESGDKSHKKVMRQTVLHAPVHWCPFPQTTPMGVIGDKEWSDVFASVEVYFPKVNSTSGVFVAVRVDHGGCTTFITRGVFFFISIRDQLASITYDIAQAHTVISKPLNISAEVWYKISINLEANTVTARVNDDQFVLKTAVTTTHDNGKGYVSLGTQSFGYADFDNLQIKTWG